MGMKPYSYVVAGIKTTHDQAKADGIDIYEAFEENEHGIKAVFGEGTDDVLIGKALVEFDAYNELDSAIELTIPDLALLTEHLVQSGVEADLVVGDVKLYAITVWL